MSQHEMEKESDNSGTPEIRWDKHYDNPDAKVILISKDNVGFRVDSWYFQKKRQVLCQVTADEISNFIKNLLDVPSQQPLDMAPIHLDIASKVVRSFVSEIYADDILKSRWSDNGFGMNNMKTIKELVDLCDRFEAPRIYAAYSETLQMSMLSGRRLVNLDVWEIFKIAALHDDVELAKTAIAALDAVGLTQSILFPKDLKSSAHFDGLPMRFVYPLLMSRYQESERYVSHGRGRARTTTCVTVWIKRDSKAIADSYEVA
jgi:hypothetical protein